MSTYEDVMNYAEECGRKGMSSKRTSEELSIHFSDVNFSDPHYDIDSPVYESYICGYGEYLESIGII